MSTQGEEERKWREREESGREEKEGKQMTKECNTWDE